MNKTDLGVALVTGASSGIGRATAQALKRAGYRVFGTSRRAVPETSDGITMLICDVTDDASVQKMVDEVLSKAGHIDLLVNNAGLGLLGGAEESSTTQAQALFDVNVFGVLRVTNAVLPTMRRQEKGRIINLSGFWSSMQVVTVTVPKGTSSRLSGMSRWRPSRHRPAPPSAQRCRAGTVRGPASGRSPRTESFRIAPRLPRSKDTRSPPRAGCGTAHSG